MIVLNQVEKRKAVEIEGYKHKNTPEQVVSARVQTARRGGGQWEGGGEQGDSWNFDERTEAGGDEETQAVEKLNQWSLNRQILSRLEIEVEISFNMLCINLEEKVNYFAM